MHRANFVPQYWHALRSSGSTVPNLCSFFFVVEKTSAPESGENTVSEKVGLDTSQGCGEETDLVAHDDLKSTTDQERPDAESAKVSCHRSSQGNFCSQPC